MTEVSVREFKNKLSEYLRRAEAGEEIAVTRRGKQVVVVQRGPGGDAGKPKTVEEKLSALVAQGRVSWNGKPFVPSGQPVKLRGKGPSLSEMIIEDRAPR